jgi:stage V sporulation protein T
MKETGIVRRIDELGRIVIPKEIRRTLGIKEGDPLEIFTNKEGEIILVPFKENSKTVDSFIGIFKEMSIEDQKAIAKMLIDEINTMR